jgi:hypothetical protein
MLKQMPHKKDNESLITNEETLVRRAWIESAIEGVRAQVDTPQPHAESGNLARKEFGTAKQHQDEGERPQLYVAWDADQRRSGT